MAASSGSSTCWRAGLAARGHDVTLFAHPDSATAGHLIPWPGRSSRSKSDTARNAATLAGAVFAGQFDLVHSFSRIAYLTPILPLPIPKLMTYQREITRRSVRFGLALSRGTLQLHGDQPLRHARRRRSRRLAPRVQRRATVDLPFPPRSWPRGAARLPRPRRKNQRSASGDRDRSARGLPLVIAGNVPPEHRGFFEAEVAPHVDGLSVKYIGPVDDQQKSALLGQARALLMPILWEEPFGIVMAEAMACGTPVIGFSRGAVPEVVEHGVTGFVADDIDGLVAAVR